MHDERIMGNIREGMRVVDAGGDEVGRVDYLQMGDSEAATASGQAAPSTLVGALAESITPGEGEPDVPEPLRTRLRRTGFIKIDAPGLLEADRYVSAEKLQSVDQDHVRLAVRKADLAKED
jgi:hypothetical protein